MGLVIRNFWIVEVGDRDAIMRRSESSEQWCKELRSVRQNGSAPLANAPSDYHPNRTLGRLPEPAL